MIKLPIKTDSYDETRLPTLLLLQSLTMLLTSQLMS